jgi:hypothetical protein
MEKEYWQEINKDTLDSYIDRLYWDGADDDSLLSGNIWVEFKQENLRDNLYDRLSAIDENVRWVGYSNSDVDKRATAREGSWWSIYISVEYLTIPEIREMFLGDRNSYDTSFNETLAEKVAEDLDNKGIKAGELGFYTYGQTFDLEISSEREYNAMVYWEDDNGKTGEVEITEIYAKSEEEAEEKAREQFNDGASPSDADNPYVTYVSISDYGSYAKGGMIDYVVVNESLFDENVRDLDLSGLRSHRGQNNEFIGDLEIELMDGSSWKTISGEFGENDYVDEYGFKIVNKSYAKGGGIHDEEEYILFVQGSPYRKGTYEGMNKLMESLQKKGFREDDMSVEVGTKEDLENESNWNRMFNKGGLVKKSDFTMLGTGLLIGGLVAFFKK